MTTVDEPDERDEDAGAATPRTPGHAARLAARSSDPVRQWKLSPTDLASLDKWEAYTDAKETMFFHTDAGDVPWTVIKSNDKKRARVHEDDEDPARFFPRSGV